MPTREKDHQSANEKTTVHDHPKKEGAGGKYTWGGEQEAMNTSPVPIDKKDPIHDHGESAAAKPKRPSQTSKTSKTGGRQRAPQNNEHNFPDLTPPGEHVPAPQGVWKKPESPH